MPIPQVTDRIKEAPAVALRALFAGIGQLLLAADKLRARQQEAAGEAASAPASPARSPAAPPAKEPATQPAKPATQPAKPATTRTSPTSARAGRPSTRAKTSAPGKSASATPAATAATKATDTPPIPQYDELSVASLRARLRVLSPDTVRALLAYEKSHAGRDDVITMFERRISKLSAG